MQKKFLITLCIACLLCIPKNYCIHTITFFMVPFTELDKQQAASIAQEKLNNPAKLASSIMPHVDDESLVAGIFSTYAGSIAISDPDGMTTFPLLHDKPIVYFLITRKITPVIMGGNTIDHWQLVDKTPAELYKVERKKDVDLNEVFWNVTKEKLPENKKISRKAIIIFANPEKIIVPLGITPTKETPNLILPDIYVKKSLTKIHDALFVLTMKHFFAPVTKLYKHEPMKHEALYY